MAPWSSGLGNGLQNRQHWFESSRCLFKLNKSNNQAHIKQYMSYKQKKRELKIIKLWD